MKRTLVVIATDYPYGFGEPFLEGELIAFSDYFSKICIVIPEHTSVDKSRKIFVLPSNAELLFLDNKTTIAHKLFAVARIFTSRAIEHLREIRKEYKLQLSLPVIKAFLAYEAKNFSFRNHLLRILKEKEISLDELYFYTCWMTEYTFSIAHLKREYPSIKVFTRMHGWDVYFERHSPPYLPYRKFILQSIDMAATISDNGRKYILEKIKDVPPEKVKTFHLGAEKGLLKLKQFQGTLILLTLSFIRPVKRMELIIDAIGKIDDVELVWHHVGGGEDDYAESIKSLAKEKLLQKRNVKFFFHGTFEKDKLYEFLSDTDIDLVVNTSVSEGLPVSIMEAMAHSIPAIAPKVGGIPEIVEHGVNGFLMSPGAGGNELVSFILEFHKMNLETKNRFRKNAYNTWNTQFNMRKNHQRFAEAVIKL